MLTASSSFQVSASLAKQGLWLDNPVHTDPLSSVTKETT